LAPTSSSLSRTVMRFFTDIERLDLLERQRADRVDRLRADDRWVAAVEVAALRIPRAEPRIDLVGRASAYWLALVLLP
jgi:hypothetical protein